MSNPRTPKTKEIKIKTPISVAEPEVINHTVLLKTRIMMQLPGGEPFEVPPDCMEVVDS